MFFIPHHLQKSKAKMESDSMRRKRRYTRMRMGWGRNETAPSLFRDGFGSLNRAVPNRVLGVIDCAPPISAAFPNRGPPLPANYPERAHSWAP
ncbi:hypothetical protein CEXT_211501 [Caerostris extrusa]|uniref:Uncharacterized protein n=1 Tax=Caerostris extrusa TaxID=172846 RepID=A0AAV4QD72_CAEEX|nr:hypothetical protein CEXT_211501 [Caerostris extrusa]